jgi:signal transduction histidine kinase
MEPSTTAKTLPISHDSCLDKLTPDEEIQRVHELRIMQQELEILRQKNTELEHLICRVSHDMKSSLVTIKAYLVYLEHDLVVSDHTQQRRDINYIRGATDNMEKLLDDVFEMSRPDRIAKRAAPVRLGELVDEAISAVAGHIADKHVKISRLSDSVLLSGDRSRLVAIWQNLLENACKYMGDQAEPQIEIGVESKGEVPVFFVRDNGMGIDPHYADTIFDQFDKIDPNSTGRGLGLAIVKWIVEMHRGRVWVESGGIGKGSTFCFTLQSELVQRFDSMS